MLTGTRRTVLMLAGCQALSMTGGSIVGLTGAIVGNMLTPDKALSTLPIAVQQAGVMAATIPAALLMARIGRRPGFWLGTAIGGVGAVIATWAIFRSSFEWFCVGTFLLGANRGTTQQYRFAAAEIADDAAGAALVLVRERRRGEDARLLGELRPGQHVDDLDLPCARVHELAQVHDVLLGSARARGVAGRDSLRCTRR